MQNLRSTACPVVFEVDHDETPFSVGGTAFLATLRGRMYAVVPSHVVRDYPPMRLRFYPQGQGRHPLKIINFWRFPCDPNDPDPTDLIVLRCISDQIGRRLRRETHVLNITPIAHWNWTPHRWTALFFLFGYPLTHAGTDYERSTINSDQYLFHGNYHGPTASEDCHEIVLNDKHQLTDFNGLSGSPVFCATGALGVAAPPVFAGMVLRGGAKPRRVRFLSSLVIYTAINEAQRHEDAG
jgi:hypothetical protein